MNCKHRGSINGSWSDLDEVSKVEVGEGLFWVQFSLVFQLMTEKQTNKTIYKFDQFIIPLQGLAHFEEVKRFR